MSSLGNSPENWLIIFTAISLLGVIITTVVFCWVRCMCCVCGKMVLPWHRTGKRCICRHTGDKSVKVHKRCEM